MSGWPRVAAWWLVAVALGWLCLASLVDRLAGQGLLVAAPRPLSFGGASQRGQAELAWRAGDVTLAARLSRAAVGRRPLDAATLRSAGSIALARGETGPGDALMRLAGAAGWRDGATQVYWGEAAVDQGAFDVAVERAEALARAGLFVEERGLLRRIEAAPAGRAALLRRWADDGAWLTNDYAAWPTDDPMAMANRYAVVAAMRPRLEADTLRRLASPLIGAGHVDWAFALTRPDERTLRFATTGWSMALDWDLSAAAGLDATVQDGGDSLHVQASGPALLPLAFRLVRLPAGTTRLELTTAGARTDMPLIATLDCLNGSGASATPVAARGDRSFFDLEVPPGCPFQWLKLAVAGEEARRGADFRLSAPTLSRAAAAP